MQKVTHITEHLLIKANTDSQWDGCSFAIIDLSPAWKLLLHERADMLSAFKADSSFSCLTYWDTHVDFFASTGGDIDDEKFGQDLLDEKEIWSYVETTPEELSRFKRTENKIRTFQLKIKSDRWARFQAWGEHTGEEFYTENFKIDDLLQ